MYDDLMQACISPANKTVTPRIFLLFLCKRLYSMQNESRLQTVQPFTESDDDRCCDNAICPPEDGHVNARNMSRIVM
jgi:hypothetical protein